MKSIICIVVMVLAGCGPMAGMIQNPGQPTAETVSTTEKLIDQAQLEAYNGPKARVAVYRFGDRTGKGKGIVHGYPGYSWYNAQIGDGMADMLNDALMLSNRFIILDRQTIKDVEYEQDLASRGRVSRETEVPTGQIEGADLLIKGSITEFEPGSSGASGGLGLGCFSLWQCAITAGGAVIGSVQQSHIAMIVQVIDAKTSRILFSTSVEGKANDFNIGGLLGAFGGGFGGIGGLGVWQKTPVEKAIRIAILQSVKELSSKTPAVYFRHQEGSVPLTQGKAPQLRVSESPTRQVSMQPPRNSQSKTADSLLPQLVTVKAKAANLRDTTGAQGNIVTTLKTGAKLFVQGEDRSWYFVQSEDGMEGWISKSLIVQ